MTKKITPAHLKKHGKRAKIPDSLSQSMAELALRMREFLEHLKLKNYSPSTVKLRRLALNYFLRWCNDRSVAGSQELNGELIAGYERLLLHVPDADGKPFTARTRYCYLTAVASFCKWLMQQDVVADNPARKLIYPQIPKTLPNQVLCHKEIEQILGKADVKTPLGLRNRALMELLYSTGMRRAEAAALTLQDVDVENGLAYVRQGKGGKARVVPLGERACQWVAKYLREAHGLLAKGRQTNALWLSQYGTAMNANILAQIVHQCVLLAGLSGSCHIFRHAMASQMLDHGADLRYIQEILGHEDIGTTQIYTQVSIEKIRQVYIETHPASTYPEPPDEPLSQSIRRQAQHPTCQPGSRTPWPVNELSRWAELYLTSLALANYTPQSISTYRRHVKSFVLYCQERQVVQPQELTLALLKLYHKHLAYRQFREQGLSVNYININMTIVRYFCTFLAEQKQLTTNIADKLPIAKKKKSLPCQVLTPQEVESLLQQPDSKTPLGLRDRAIIELFYATGMRRQELIALEVENIHFAQASVFITKGKGGKQRLVPVAPSALAWVAKYLQEVRPMLCDEQGSRALFLGMHGLPLDPIHLNVRLQQYARKAGITKHVTCHQLRHAMATAMLDNGADIRSVQEILGHSDLHSTQIYTKVAIRRLKEVHSKTHPARSQPSHDAGGHDATDDHDASESR